MEHWIAIATCQRLPGILSDDAILVAALEAAGWTVIAAPWNGPFEPFAQASLTLVRSTWDYPDDPVGFLNWIDRFSGEHQLVNPAALMRWNLSKNYLFELADASIPMAPLLKTPSCPDAILAAMDQLRIDRAVVKPVIGASAAGLTLVTRDDADAIAAAADRINGEALVQQFLPTIQTSGEISLMFMGKEFTHAVRKRPETGDIRVQSEHGGSEQLIPLSHSLLEFGHRVLSACPIRPTYARVDIVEDGSALHLMELELIEPALFFKYHPSAADHLISGLRQHLG